MCWVTSGSASCPAWRRVVANVIVASLIRLIVEVALIVHNDLPERLLALPQRGMLIVALEQTLIVGKRSYNALLHCRPHLLNELGCPTPEARVIGP